MAVLTPDLVRQKLASVPYPGFSRDIVSFGIVKDVRIDGVDVTVQMVLSTSDPAVPQSIKTNSEAALSSLPGIGQARVLIDIQAPPKRPGPQGGEGMARTAIEGVRHIIAVASGKGGVGKSTVASNLAAGLAAQGSSVGLCDCDIYGPSVALMFGSRERPMATEDEQIIPIERYGVKLMSMGFLLDDSSPAVLRGPMVTRYTQQFLRQVDWGRLDYLVLDLPPGTGDIQLTIVQTVALAGAIIVTTPQEVALIDARKAATMFEKVNVPVLGIIENMSYFVCPKDQTRYDIFGTGGGRREARRLNVPLLGEVPIDIPTREAGDQGKPVTLLDPENPSAREFLRISDKLHQSLSASKPAHSQ